MSGMGQLTCVRWVPGSGRPCTLTGPQALGRQSGKHASKHANNNAVHGGHSLVLFDAVLLKAGLDARQAHVEHTRVAKLCARG